MFRNRASGDCGGKEVLKTENTRQNGKYVKRVNESTDWRYAQTQLDRGTKARERTTKERRRRNFSASTIWYITCVSETV